MAKKVKNVHWIKWWSKETIYGSYMTEPIDSLGFLVKMCCFSAETRYPGYIQSEYQKGIPHHNLAPLLNIPLDEFERMLRENIEKNRLSENGSGVIEIMNWEKFQTIDKWDGNPATAPEPEGSEQGEFGVSEKHYTHPDELRHEIKCEDDDLIFGQSVEKAIKIAQGKIEAIPRAKKTCQDELDRRGIKWRQN